MFFTTNKEGFLEMNDILVSHSGPLERFKIADFALNCLKVSKYIQSTINESIA